MLVLPLQTSLPVLPVAALRTCRATLGPPWLQSRIRRSRPARRAGTLKVPVERQVELENVHKIGSPETRHWSFDVRLHQGFKAINWHELLATWQDFPSIRPNGSLGRRYS